LEKILLFRQNNGLPSPLTCLSVGTKGKFVVCGDADSNIFIVDTRNGKLKKTIDEHAGKISGVCFIEDRYNILSSSWDATTRLLDTRGKKSPRVLKHTTEVKALAASQELGKGVAGARDGEIKIFSLSTLKNLRNVQAHTSDVSGVAILDDAAKLVSTSWDGECKIWNMTSYEYEETIFKADERIRALTTTPDGMKIILGLHSGKILVINTENPSDITELKGHTDIVEALSTDTTGERLVSGSWDRTIRLWSLNSNKEFESGNLLAGITAVQWDPKDEVVYSVDFSGAVISWSI
jgi:WD40 repeat protein